MRNFLLFRKHLFAWLLISCVFTAKSFAQAYDLVVAKDGSGNFTTVGEALRAAPTNRTTPYRIFVKNGKYREKDTVPSNKPFIHLIGESVADVIISWDDFSGKPNPAGGTFGTSNSATFFVNATDFVAINITFENTTGESPQALAINVTGDRAAFKNCRFLGGQDTVFDGGNGARHYYRNCYIDGTVDFIFGDGRAVFDSTVIYAKTRSAAGVSYITAANTKQSEPYGYVFRDCIIPPNRGGTTYFLGRPWQNDESTPDAAKSYNKTIFLNTTMSSAVHPAGWSTWNAGTDVSKITYAEYRSRKFDSTLIDLSQRVSWSKQLTASEAAVYYNNTNLFGSWDPCSIMNFCTYTPRPIAVSNFRGVKGTNTSTFTWNISWPMAGIKYEILRSSDRTTFTKVSEQTSTSDSLVNFSYTENIPPPGVTYFYLVQASKAGLNTHITDTAVISSTPTINVAGSMGSFKQGVGTPSNPQSYTITGASLTNNLVITAPAGYEISANNGTTWNNSSTPIILTPTSNGNVATTPITVRLNASTAGTYNGDIIHASSGADTVRLPITGIVQSEPLAVSQLLQWYPMTTNNMDSTEVRAAGVSPATTTFRGYSVSNGITYDAPALPAYSATHGQAISGSPNGEGDWRTASGGPGSTLHRGFYEQFVVKATSTHSLRVDSLILNSSFYSSSSSTRIAVQFSRTGFATDSSEISGATVGGTAATYVTNNNFVRAIALPQDNNSTTFNIRYAINGAEGISLASGDSLIIRIYFSCGSTSRNRYAKLKDVMFKGLSTANPLAGDYRTKQSGNWTDLNTWERYDGTQWISPAPEFPHFSNTSGTQILSGHTVTHSTNFTQGFGYIPRRTKINNGGQLIVSNGASLNVGNDGTPAAATPDLQVDGTLILLGGIFTNSNVFVLINGNFINSGTGMNLSNTGDTVAVGPNGRYQHNVNNATTPTRLSFDPTATFVVSGLVSTQTNVIKNNVTYGNIVWNNTGATAYYAIRTTLDSSNVKGSFTVQSTGTTNLTFANSSSRLVLPGGYCQTGGTVNYRESGNVTDTLDLGADFSVTGGTFNSNAGTGSSLLIRLNGFNKTIQLSQGTATNTNWEVNGSYNLASNLTIPSTTFGVNVKGSLNMGTFVVSGSGDFATQPGAILSSGAATGLNGNITATGAKNLSTGASYIFSGATAQTTGSLLPATVNGLTINNAADVTLNGGSVNVTGGLTLTNGKLILGNNTVTTSSVLGNTLAKYVVTNGSGALKITSVGAGNNVFPVGPTTASYNPTTINNAGASDNFSVNVKTTFDQPLPDSNKAVNRQWTINEDVAGGSNATISLSWLAADQAAGFNRAAVINILRYNGSTWEKYPATISGEGTAASPYVATVIGITAFGQFVVVNETALPLTLLSFNAGYDNNDLNIWWKTTNEINTKSFQVERSIDARSFTAIGTIKANSLRRDNNYSFTDRNPVNGIVYYRLKSIDTDGLYKYSHVVTVNSKLKGKITIYPNPATNTVTLTHGRANVGATINVFTVDGKKVISQKLEVNATQTTVNVTSLSKGVYSLVLNDRVEKTTVSFIKK